MHPITFKFDMCDSEVNFIVVKTKDLVMKVVALSEDGQVLESDDLKAVTEN